jgi:hypothetical protein
VKELALLLAIVFAFAAPSVAEGLPAEPEPSPPRLGAAFWLLQDGSADQGPSYDLLSLESPRRPGQYWRLSLLVGAASGGLALTTDLWTETTRAGRVTLTMGGAVLTKSPEAGAWSPGLVCTIRVNGTD